MSENSWIKRSIVFRLESPLHIGYLPFKGSVISPTRYYIPGRTFWGAVTKRITEKLETKNYISIGRQIKKNFRFSYFYLYDGKTVYFPHYSDKGLKYGNLTEEEFEHRFIGSMVSTAIESSSSTARYRSLHEIEFIKNKFRDEKGELKDVKIAGSIWMKKNIEIENENKNDAIRDERDVFSTIQELILGGESKYGFGHVLFDSNSISEIESLDLDIAPFNWGDDPETITIKSDEPLTSHLKYDKSLNFYGDIELLTGRGYFDPKNIDTEDENEKSKINNNTIPGKVISEPEYYLSPGSAVRLRENESLKLKVNWDGTVDVRE